jgi:hypothetical protein
VTKHTPGPWSVINGNLIRVSPRNNASPICGVHLRGVDGDEAKRREVALANAHLIAAAPDLLGALKAISDGLRDTESTPGQWMTRITKPQAYEIARAAIAKAEEG